MNLYSHFKTCFSSYSILKFMSNNGERTKIRYNNYFWRVGKNKIHMTIFKPLSGKIDSHRTFTWKEYFQAITKFSEDGKKG